MAREPVKIDWMVPNQEWQATREWVEDEYGSLSGYLGRAAENAMEEFVDDDEGYAELESKIDRLIKAAGRTPEDLRKEKKSSQGGPSLASQPTTRVTARVDEHIKTRFKKYADRHTDYGSYGVALGRAIREYRTGGRPGRLNDKLDRVVDDAESVLAELDDGEAAKEGLSTVQRREIIICNRLPEQFTDEELNAEIRDVAGASEPTVEKYRERVIERLGYEPHPNAAHVWLPAEKASEIAQDGVPREYRVPVEVLCREDRVRRLQVALVHEATRSKGTGGFRATTSEIREHVFDTELSLSSVRDLCNQAALNSGFTMDRSNNRVSLGVNVTNSIDDDIAEIVQDLVKHEIDSPFKGPIETGIDDFTDPEPESQSPAEPNDIEIEFSKPTADGGGSPRKENDG